MIKKEIVLGFCFTSFGVYRGIKDSPKIRKAIKEKKNIAKACLPTILLELFGWACIAKYMKSSENYILKLSQAYSFTNKRYEEFKRKGAEVLGESKMQKIREAISKEHLYFVNALPSGSICYDEILNKTFHCSAEQIGNLIASIKRSKKTWVSLSEFYKKLGIDICNVEDFGWNPRKGVPIYFTVINKNEVPCLCISYDLDFRMKKHPYNRNHKVSIK